MVRIKNQIRARNANNKINLSLYIILKLFLFNVLKYTKKTYENKTILALSSNIG